MNTNVKLLTTVLMGLFSASLASAVGWNGGSVPSTVNSFGSADNRESGLISPMWGSSYYKTEITFEKGEGSGEFYFTQFTVNADPSISADFYATLNCNNVTLDMSQWIKVEGRLNATDSNIVTPYLRVGPFGVLNMNGGSLILTGDRSGLDIISEATYKISNEMILKDVTFTAAGSVIANTVSNTSGQSFSGDITFSGTTSFSGTSLIINSGSSLSVLDTASVNVDSLSAASLIVSGNAKINVDSADNIAVSNLSVILNEAGNLDFSEIFSTDNGETIVFSSEQNISVYDANGDLYDDVLFSYDESGNITGITAVPEPSTYAALFGAIALAFAAYRRRK